MCWDCFKEYADKPVVNERVVAAYDLMANRDAGSTTLLHVIVGDMNVDDWFFDLNDPDGKNRMDRYDAAEQWERDIFDALAALTEEERATAVVMEWGYISRDGTLRPDLIDSRPNS
jgi:hypothetical protein